MTATRDDILAAARECIGTPFVHQGRALGVGLDCAGVVCHVANRLGLSYTAPSGYSRQPHKGALKEVLDSQSVLFRVYGPPRQGDVLLMRFVKEPQHLGIYTGDGVIHAYEAAGKCCEHGLDDAWRRRIVSVYRFRGDE